MNFADLVPAWLDAVLIWPFRLFPSYTIACFWLGCFFLSTYAVLLGEIVYSFLYWVNRRYYTSLDDEMIKSHNISVAALHAGDKKSYLAVNKEAHDHFGKSFFAGAALGMASLWPVPFALGWLSLRFENVPIFSLPFIDWQPKYAFVFLAIYIPERIIFARIKKHLPGFRNVIRHRQEASQARPPLRSFFR